MAADVYEEHGLVRWDGREFVIIAPPRRWNGLEAEPEFATEAILVHRPVGQDSWDLSTSHSRTVDVQPGDARIVWEAFGVEVKNCHIIFDTPAPGDHVVVLIQERRG